MEIVYIVCDMNLLVMYDNIIVIKNGQLLIIVYLNGINYYYINVINKYEIILGMFFIFIIKDVLCLDKNDYMFIVEDGGRVMCLKILFLDIKGKIFDMYINYFFVLI